MMHQEPFRISPLGRPGAYKTYSLLAPLATHWRVITCAEAECVWHTDGWLTIIDEATPNGERQAAYIRTDKTRHYTERRDGPLTVFHFPPGQEGFPDPNRHPPHKIRSDREPDYAVRPGDYRAYGVPYLHDSPEFWIEDFAGHLDKIDKQANR